MPPRWLVTTSCPPVSLSRLVEVVTAVIGDILEQFSASSELRSRIESCILQDDTWKFDLLKAAADTKDRRIFRCISFFYYPEDAITSLTAQDLFACPVDVAVSKFNPGSLVASTEDGLSVLSNTALEELRTSAQNWESIVLTLFAPVDEYNQIPALFWMEFAGIGIRRDQEGKISRQEAASVVEQARVNYGTRQNGRKMLEKRRASTLKITRFVRQYETLVSKCKEAAPGDALSDYSIALERALKVLNKLEKGRKKGKMNKSEVMAMASSFSSKLSTTFGFPPFHHSGARFWKGFFVWKEIFSEVSKKLPNKLCWQKLCSSQGTSFLSPDTIEAFHNYVLSCVTTPGQLTAIVENLVLLCDASSAERDALWDVLETGRVPIQLCLEDLVDSKSSRLQHLRDHAFFAPYVRSDPEVPSEEQKTQLATWDKILSQITEVYGHDVFDMPHLDKASLVLPSELMASLQQAEAEDIDAIAHNLHLLCVTPEGCFMPVIRFMEAHYCVPLTMRDMTDKSSTRLNHILQIMSEQRATLKLNKYETSARAGSLPTCVYEYLGGRRLLDADLLGMIHNLEIRRKNPRSSLETKWALETLNDLVLSVVAELQRMLHNEVVPEAEHTTASAEPVVQRVHPSVPEPVLMGTEPTISKEQKGPLEATIPKAGGTLPETLSVVAHIISRLRRMCCRFAGSLVIPALVADVEIDPQDLSKTRAALQEYLDRAVVWKGVMDQVTFYQDKKTSWRRLFFPRPLRVVSTEVVRNLFRSATAADTQPIAWNIHLLCSEPVESDTPLVTIMEYNGDELSVEDFLDPESKKTLAYRARYARNNVVRVKEWQSPLEDARYSQIKTVSCHQERVQQLRNIIAQIKFHDPQARRLEALDRGNLRFWIHHLLQTLNDLPILPGEVQELYDCFCTSDEQTLLLSDCPDMVDHIRTWKTMIERLRSVMKHEKTYKLAALIPFFTPVLPPDELFALSRMITDDNASIISENLSRLFESNTDNSPCLLKVLAQNGRIQALTAQDMCCPDSIKEIGDMYRRIMS